MISSARAVATAAALAGALAAAQTLPVYIIAGQSNGKSVAAALSDGRDLTSARALNYPQPPQPRARRRLQR